MTHIEGEVDPIRDLEIIFEELRLKDEEHIGKTLKNVEGVAIRGTDKSKKLEYVRFQKKGPDEWILVLVLFFLAN